MLQDMTQTGLHTLRDGHDEEALALLRSRRLGLLTNHTGRASDGQSTLEVLRVLGCEVRALFSPEHGPAGQLEGDVASGRAADGLPVYSLYGQTRRPTGAMLEGVETLVCDLQDVGARFYTYASTLAYAMEECARRGVAVVVLDRPNPLGGVLLEGPLLEAAHRSFVGYLDVPIRHGLTLGELALLHRYERALDLDLRVVRLRSWRRDMTWPQTHLNWPAPSPNLPDYQSAAWYPGLCLLEFSGLSVGRGTDAPFQIFGAPWLKPDRVLRALTNWPPTARAGLLGQAIEFTPARGEWADTPCRGLRLAHENGAPPHPVALGLALLSTLHQTHAGAFDEPKLRASLPLLGSSAMLELLRAGDVAAALELSRAQCRRFDAHRRDFFLYS
jgi:uncharacterized protein YbbC (DUF1343 family)